MQRIQSPLSITQERERCRLCFFELTRSICPECRQVVHAHIILRDNKVYMRKRFPDHGQFEALVYADAQAYVDSARFNKNETHSLTIDV